MYLMCLFEHLVALIIIPGSWQKSLAHASFFWWVLRGGVGFFLGMGFFCSVGVFHISVLFCCLDSFNLGTFGAVDSNLQSM